MLSVVAPKRYLLKNCVISPLPTNKQNKTARLASRKWGSGTATYKMQFVLVNIYRNYYIIGIRGGGVLIACWLPTDRLLLIDQDKKDRVYNGNRYVHCVGDST